MAKSNKKGSLSKPNIKPGKLIITPGAPPAKTLKPKKKPQSAHQIRIAKKLALNRRDALEYRCLGHTYREIAEMMSGEDGKDPVSIWNVRDWVKAGIADIPAEAAEEARTIEMERLDVMFSRVMNNFLVSEGSDLLALEAMLKIQNQRTKYVPLQTQPSAGDRFIGALGQSVGAHVGANMAQLLAADRPMLHPDCVLPANPIM